MELNDNKAGMQGLDKEHINAVIRENTGANYQKHQEKRDQRMQERIARNQRVLDSLTPAQISAAEQRMDALMNEIEATRDLSRTIVHVDMDAFYAAVEMRDNPDLRNIPMAVGSDSMLSTSNYAARKFGVRAAMPGFIARKLCPQLTIVRCDYDKYRSASKRVQVILAHYDPDFSMGGLDEAYLDLTNIVQSRSQSNQLIHEYDRVRYAGDCLCRLPRIAADDSTDGASSTTCSKCGKTEIILSDKVSFGNSIEEVTAEMRFKIEQATGLTASAGIASNAMLAKICSDRNKPNGQFYLPADLIEIAEFVKNLPIRKVCGIGGVTEKQLKAVGVVTCAQLHEKRAILSLLFSEISVYSFIRISLGIGSNDISTHDHERKSISVERTFGNTKDPEELFAICKRLSESLAEDVSERDLSGKTVTLKLKLSSFDVKTRAASGGHLISTSEQIYEKARELLRKEMVAAGELELRLMGVRLSNLTPKPVGNIAQFFVKKPDVVDTVVSPAPPVDDASVVAEDDFSVASCSTDVPTTVAEPETDSVPSTFLCPVCEHKLPNSRSLNELNAHIDDCLSRRTIAQVMGEEDVAGRAPSKAAVHSVEPSKAAVHSVQPKKPHRTKRTTVAPPPPAEAVKMRRLDFYFPK